MVAGVPYRPGYFARPYGCNACHTLDGSPRVGPSFKGLWARIQSGETKFTDGHALGELLGPGKQFATPEDYVRAKTLTPRVNVIEGYEPKAPAFAGVVTDEDMVDMIEYLKTL